MVEGFPDVNADGHQDVLIACRRQAVLFAFNGKNGALLWYYNAGISGAQSKTIHRPMPLGDLDGDDVEDYGSLFINFGVTDNLTKISDRVLMGMGKKTNTNVVRSLDVVSGKTGKRISRRFMPATLFDAPQAAQLSSACQSSTFSTRTTYCGLSPIAIAGDVWTYRQAAEQPIVGELMPWEGVLIPNTIGKSSNGKSNSQLLIACGSKIISCDPATGEPGKFNEGQPLELGFVPALQPQLVSSFGKDQSVLGLLLAEIVTKADNQKGTKPITRFSLRSLESGEEIWHFDADYQLDWYAGAGSFPIVADLNGDATRPRF